MGRSPVIGEQGDGSVDAPLDTVSLPVSKGYVRSFHEETVAEAGKAMLLDSLGVGREFCKFMIGVSTGSVPIYLALAAFVSDGTGETRTPVAGYWLVPVALFVTAAATFARAYLPDRDEFSLDILEDIEQHRARTINKYYRLSVLGGLLLILATLTASIILLFCR